MKPLVFAAVGVTVAVLAACSTKAKLIAQGGECLQATDCADGLVCVPQKDGRRLCDNDLSLVQSTEDAAAPAPTDAGRRDGSADAASDAPTPPPDSGTDADDGAVADSATE